MAANLQLVISAVDKASGTLSNIEKKTRGLGKAFDTALKTGVLAGAAGIGIAVVAAIKFTKQAAEEEAGIKRLAAAIDANGGSWRRQGAQIEAAIKQRQKLAFSDDDLRSSLALLTAITGNADEALRRQTIAMDFARGANIDLNMASKLLGKVTDENVNVLGRYGIRVEKGASATELLRKVQQKFAGQSKAFADTTVGRWARFNIALDNVKETIGKALLPIASRLADTMSRFLEDHEDQIGRVVQAWVTFAGSQVFPRIGRAIGDLGQVVGRFVGVNLDSVKYGTATWMAILEEVGKIASGAAQIIRDDLGVALNALTSIAAPVFETLKKLFDQIGLKGEGKGVDKAQALAVAIEAIIGAIILGKVAALAGEVAGLVGSLAGVVSKSITITQNVVHTGEKLISGLVDTVQNITQKITKISVSPSAEAATKTTGKTSGKNFLAAFAKIILSAAGGAAGLGVFTAIKALSAGTALLGGSIAALLVAGFIGGVAIGLTAAKIFAAIKGETLQLDLSFSDLGNTYGGRLVQFIVRGIRDAAVALPGAIAFVIGVIAAALTVGIAGLGVLAFREITKAFAAFGNWVANSALPGVVTFFSSTLPSTASKFFSAFPGMIKTLVLRDLPKLPGWIASAAIPGIITFFSQTLPAAAVKGADFAIRMLKLIGGALWGAILSGLKSGLALFAPIADFFSGLWDKFKSGYNWFLDKLQARSPSKLFMRVGASIPQGLIAGIRSGAAQIEQSMRDLLPREFASPAFPSMARGASGADQNAAPQMAAAGTAAPNITITNVISGTWDLTNPNHIERLTSALTAQIRRNLAMGA